MKLLYFMIILLIGGCNDNVSDINSSESYSPEPKESFTMISREIAQLNDSQECWELGISYTSASTENYKEYGKETAQGMVISGVVYKILEGEDGLFYQIDCPAEEELEETVMENLPKADCFSLSQSECGNYPEECRPWITKEFMVVRFEKENFCLKPNATPIFVLCIRQNSDILGDDGDGTMLSEHIDIMKNKNTGELILINRGGKVELPNSLEEGIGDWEMDLETFSEMLLYYQELSIKEGRWYNYPNVCE